jgi:CubicO group peptidase (beta-lactamase class C family)
MVVAGIINKLHDDGVLDLDAPVSTYLTDWASPAYDMTLAQLISNTSGLPGLFTPLNTLTATSSPDGAYGCMWDGTADLEECGKTIYEAAPSGTDQIIPPDNFFQYGGGQWQIAGAVAKVVSGKTISELFNEIYAEPCGLTHSGWHNSVVIGDPPGIFQYPPMFDGTVESIPATENPSVEGGMYTTMADYGKLLQMYLHNGKCGTTEVHPPTTIARILDDRLASVGLSTGWGALGFPEGYGMGWYVDRNEPGWFSDPGAFGSVPYLDFNRNIAVFNVFEGNVFHGIGLLNPLRTTVAAAIDEILAPGGALEEHLAEKPEMLAVNAMISGFLADYPMLEGAAVTVLHKDLGVIHDKSYGAFEDDRVYQIASSSKIVVAGIINRLHDDGILDMYAPISSLVTDWPALPYDVSLAQMISNSSGLPGLQSGSNFNSYGCQVNPTDTLQNCAATILTTAPAEGETIVPPDTVFQYGGAQWQLAGAVIEAVTGKNINELYNEIYAGPCNLTASGFSNMIQFGGAFVLYPEAFDGTLDTIVETENPFIEAGMYSSVSDYMKILKMHLDGGVCGINVVHPPSTIARMQEDRIKMAWAGSTNSTSIGLQGYGMGWWIDRNEPTWVTDPGAYGSSPFIDNARGIAVFGALETDFDPAANVDYLLRLRAAVTNAVDAIIPPPEAPAAQPEMLGVNVAIAKFLENNPDLEGAAVTVIHKYLGVLHHKNYGEFYDERVYAVASASKMVIAGIINKLHDDGILDMNAPISTYVPDWTSGGFDYSLAQMISNTSGLPGLFNPDTTMTATSVPTGPFGCMWDVDADLEECGKTIYEATAAAPDQIIPPDNFFQYGGGQWQVAGAVVQIITGKTINELFDEIYAVPCGLTSSGFSHMGPPDLSSPILFPYPIGGTLASVPQTTNTHVEGGMYTTLGDYTKLLQMYLDGGACGANQVHSAETIAFMQADRLADLGLATGWSALGLPDGYGMGWWVDRNEPGWVLDLGAYGALPYIDNNRDIAVLALIEGNTFQGLELLPALRATVSNAVDAFQPAPAAPAASSDGGDDASDGSDDATGATDGASDATDGASDATDGAADATDGAADATDGAADATDGASDATDGA